MTELLSIYQVSDSLDILSPVVQLAREEEPMKNNDIATPNDANSANGIGFVSPSLSVVKVLPPFYRRVLLFDTETTGLMPKRPRNGDFPPNEAYPYIMQLSWVIYNLSTNTIEESVNEYVKIPESVAISPEATKVHGITRNVCREKGKPIVPLLAKFFVSYMKCDCIVAHNLSFDSELVRKEMWRNRVGLTMVASQERVNMMCGIFTKKFNAAYHIDTFCTMMSTIGFCNIDFVSAKSDPSSNVVNKPTTRKKFPRLTELYDKLFGEESSLPVDMHNSMIDVLVCLRCFLKVRGAIEMPEQIFRDWIDTYTRASE